MSPELLVALDRRAREPLRTQLESALREAIRSGRLRSGERLPSSRALARGLGVSRGLVQECYSQLQAEGFLATRSGSATRVADGAGAGAATAGAPSTQDGTLRSLPMVADFRSGVPDLASFPRTDWAWAMREACRTAPNAALDYGDPAGRPELQEVLAGYLRRVRSAVASPADVVVSGGFAQGLTIVLRVLHAAGSRRVAFEDPGYNDVRVLASAAPGIEAVPIPVDDAGIDVTALAASDADAVVLTPAHQWPTGVVLAPDRRQALVAWARQRTAVLIEDSTGPRGHRRAGYSDRCGHCCTQRLRSPDGWCGIRSASDGRSCRTPCSSSSTPSGHRSSLTRAPTVWRPSTSSSCGAQSRLR